MCSTSAETVAESLRSVAERAGVTVYTHLSTDATVRGNSHIIDEMIYNLADNAIKYNRDGGEVHISLEEKGDNILLSVRDTGIGIPKDKQGRVFERFYRIDKSHSKEIGGTGLGLSIVKHGANYHKAQIMLKSEIGVGTEITVSFPKAPMQ